MRDCLNGKRKYHEYWINNEELWIKSGKLILKARSYTAELDDAKEQTGSDDLKKIATSIKNNRQIGSIERKLSNRKDLGIIGLYYVNLNGAVNRNISASIWDPDRAQMSLPYGVYDVGGIVYF
ncbi:Uncharacterised protein r2_g4251 [Pycnogonum litorale]